MVGVCISFADSAQQTHQKHLVETRAFKAFYLQYFIVQQRFSIQ
jgi:hypothetical protein